MTETVKTERRSFEAEVGRLLDIVANALYSEREVFLRELISNAADACDRLRYEAIATPSLLEGAEELGITLKADAEAGTLTISDSGIGMSRDELIANLGTIARSGSSAFLQAMQEDERRNLSLIGQFGVGFYSAFMVAATVTVTSRRAGASEAWAWSSDGKGSYELAPAERATRGTDIVLTLKEDAREFLETSRLERVVKTYSDHIPVPICLVEAGKDEGPRQLNKAGALWTRPKSEISEQDYTEFYHHVGHGFDTPWATLHFRAEGVLEYTGLLYVPGSRPFDLFDPERKAHVKLYVKRVFITDECSALVPSWLRFLRGVIDSEDLPLAISREMLQTSPVLAKIRQGLTKRVLSELEKRAKVEDEEGRQAYETFWSNFGPVLKEGIYEDAGQRDTLLDLARFRLAGEEGLVSLAQYLERIAEGQSAIYYISGEDAEALARSPQLEGFRARGIPVLLMTDPVDEFWIPSVGQYGDKPFKSVTQGSADLSAIKSKAAASEESATGNEAKPEEKADDGKLGTLIAKIKTALGEAVSDVRKSERLTDSPVCLVATEGGLDMNIERLLRRHKQLDAVSRRVLEINPGHPLIRALAESDIAADMSDAAHLLLDQARILEGESLPDPAAFARRMTLVMTKAL